MRYRQSHQEISRKLRKKDQEIEAINAQIARLRDGVQVRAGCDSRPAARAVHGRPIRALETVARVRFLRDFQRRLRYLSAVSARDYGLLETFKHDMATMQDAERRREAARVGMLAYKRSTEKHLDEIKAVKKEKKLYLAKLTQEKESYERALQEWNGPPRASTVCFVSWSSAAERRRPAAFRFPAEGSQRRPPLAGGGQRAPISAGRSIRPSIRTSSGRGLRSAQWKEAPSMRSWPGQSFMRTG